MDKTTLLKSKIYKILNPDFEADVKQAIEFAEKEYQGMKRYNGDPMIEHALSLAITLLEYKLDFNTVLAGIIHEIPSEKEKEIKTLLGEDVLNIYKIARLVKEGTNATETHPEIVNKYILNRFSDLRPIILKIYDALQDVRTIENVPEEKKKETLNKALSIYATLAEYLGMDETKKEIEENAFREYLPLEHKSITQKLQELKVNQALLTKYEKLLREQTKNLSPKPKLEGRMKSKYSIYNKLKKYEKEWKNPEINRLSDLIAFRIILQDEDSCYKILEKLMDNGELVYDEFSDYIAQPKPNGYRAIQFPISFPKISNIPIEIQILTEEMYYVNTYGTASHIAYKASKSRYAKPTNKYNWVENIHKQIKISSKNNRKTRSSPINIEIFQEEVFVFTPKLKIIQLDKGDTVLDFAFRLHTHIGDSAVSAKVNGKPAKLSEILKTGDIVEIKTDKSKKYQQDKALQYANSESTKLKILKHLSKNLKKL